MIKIKVAGLTVGLDNRYSYVERLAADYTVDDDAEVDFTVSATDEEIAAEREAGEAEFTDGYLESIVLYRNIAERLPLYSAAVFHGAVIAIDGKAYAVTARSGVGKTTHLRIWQRVFGERVHILNGDKPILRIIDGKVHAAGTPWRGKESYGVNEMLPLCGIAFIDRGEENSAEPLSASAALIPFITQLYVPKGERCARLALALSSSIISSVPLVRLRANMQDDAALVAYRALVGEDN